MGIAFEPYSADWQQDPYPVFRELRDAAPVHYAPDSRLFCVSRHADVQRVLRDAEVFSSRNERRRRGEDFDLLTRLRLLVRFVARMKVWPTRMRDSRMLIQEGGEVHATMRNLVNRGFTPRRIAAWELRIREILAERMPTLVGRESFDLVHEIAIPLPVSVIAEMLGIERERMHDFKRWSDAIIQGGTGSAIDNPLQSGMLDALAELHAYLRPIVKARRKQPREDLISTLVETTGEGALADFEVFLFVLLLLVAGNETTTNLLGNAVDALLAHPEQLERVARDPSLVPGLVEETLRWDSPVQLLVRTALVPTQIAGVAIPAGAQVAALLGSANRDERMFPEPDRFDVTRDTRGHVAFGFGAHFCLGASLARLEAKASLESIVPLLPSLVRLRPEREFLDSYVVRGRTRLELKRVA